MTIESPAMRAGVAIPDGWRGLPWPALKSLAAKLTDDPVRDKTDAIDAVSAELTRRAMPAMGDDLPPLPEVEAEKPAPKPAPAARALNIPPNWHETLSVADIITLARSISPDGNPVDVIRAEIARTGKA